MKEAVRSAVDSALTRLISDERLPADCLIPDFQVEVPKNPDHGDFSCNIAMLLARSAKRPPRELASDLAANLCENPAFSAVNVAGPGFINFVCADAQVFAVVHQVLKSEAAYGRSDAGSGRRVQVEFVSANPTGPLHIGHGRGAAIGSAVAALLEATGHSVTREYYVNDAGRQMDILALSVFLRRMELSSLPVELPLNAYQGDYILEIAQQIEPEIVTKDLGGRWQDWVVSANSQTEADDEATLDVLIAGARQVLGDESFRQIRRVAKDSILQGIRSDLAHFGVEFDVWFSEESLSDQRKVEHAVAALEDRGYLFKDGGAKWFRSTDFGDEKDRVVVRENGSITYFASDIAYHLDKFTRGFSEVINIWGADHHGYVARVKAALSALGLDPGRLDVLLVQFAALVRGGEHVAMSTRSGEFVTLSDLVNEVGPDAARFFYVMRRSDQHLEFDLDLATSQNNENPVYYVQYAHARIASVFRQCEQRGLPIGTLASSNSSALGQPAERRLAFLLWQYPELLLTASRGREPHLVTQFLRDLATEFHGYYNGTKILDEDIEVRTARLALIRATQQVLANGLQLLAISAPEEM